MQILKQKKLNTNVKYKLKITAIIINVSHFKATNTNEHTFLVKG